MSAKPQEEIFVDQSLEELLPIVATEFDAISRKPIQSSFLARDLVRMYDKISFYRQKDFELNFSRMAVQKEHDDSNLNNNNNNNNHSMNENASHPLVESSIHHQQASSFSSELPPQEQRPVDNNISKDDHDDSNGHDHTTTTATTTTVASMTTTSDTTSTTTATIANNNNHSNATMNCSSPQTQEKTIMADHHERITQFVYQHVDHEFEKFSHLTRNLDEMEKEDRGDQIFVDLLNTLTRLFHSMETLQECKPLLTLQEFKNIVVSKSVPNYVSTLMEGQYGDGHPLVKFLTLVDQAFVVSLLGHFAESLFFTKTPIRFKDIRGTWRIDIRMYQNCISMVHRRTEQMMKPLGNTMLKNLFQFSWQVEIVYDSYKLDHIHSIHVTLLEIDWESYDESLELTSQQKGEVQQVFLKMFSKSKTGGELGYQLPLKITLSDISPKHLRLLVKELKENAKKLVKPSNDSNGSSGSWFSGIFSSSGCMDDTVDFISNSKRRD
ncbi:hypothetical protein FDP41_011416 [Naegleria fowleri]|uniref:Ras guanine nucleotide exchange factor glfB-like C-terminal domain-containing protein n=1 Tax=Naegleria fowleri TaxID=5763 RepID=A0A6A5C409_NAEFO|nr:uncharacterized protein FDP41_011416 [Naegleria fowleri]KAF0982486.1 hypothetical protein FDP41_011416 [Naegleria fowleri]